MGSLSEKAAQNLAALRKKKPLVHSIVNYVAANYTANALLAMGALPVMAHAQSEAEETVSLADALVVNIGTLVEDRIPPMIKAGRKAAALGKPIVFDPVGSGGTRFRTFIAVKVAKEIGPSVIRGNASEILSLGNMESKPRGVEAVHSVEDVTGVTNVLAEGFKTTIAVTGPKDLVTDGRRIFRVLNGHPLMAYVTGSGCTASVTIGAFAAIDADPVTATATALAFWGLAGEVAGQSAAAPGSFMIEMLNALYSITPEMLEGGCKIEKG
jgi:hydroxyethylthiazole kinase